MEYSARIEVQKSDLKVSSLPELFRIYIYLNIFEYICIYLSEYISFQIYSVTLPKPNIFVIIFGKLYSSKYNRICIQGNLGPPNIFVFSPKNDICCALWERAGKSQERAGEGGRVT